MYSPPSVFDLCSVLDLPPDSDDGDGDDNDEFYSDDHGFYNDNHQDTDKHTKVMTKRMFQGLKPAQGRVPTKRGRIWSLTKPLR